MPEHGMPEPRMPERLVPAAADPELPDLAAATLAGLRKSLRGTKPGPVNAKKRKKGYVAGPQMSGAGPDERDPVTVRAGIDELVSAMGWEDRAKVAAVTSRWPEIAGAELASHVMPESFDEASGLLRLRAESTAWATQVRMLAPALLAKLDTEIGAGIVRSIEVAGPAAPRRNYGNLRVPGRGPRDTYG